MISASLLAAALAVSSPAPSPINVLRCSTGTEVSDMLYKTDGNYQIEFVNQDAKVVDEIVFDIHLGSRDIPIRDAGKFSTGVPVVHRFPNRGGEIILVGKPAISCEVKWVRFTDGTQWTES